MEYFASFQVVTTFTRMVPDIIQMATTGMAIMAMAMAMEITGMATTTVTITDIEITMASVLPMDM
jgi:hypothetical protein